MNQFIDRPTAKDPEEAKAFIQKITENKSYYWGITLKENGKMILAQATCDDCSEEERRRFANLSRVE